MCSCRTYVPMIACLVIPGFELRAALRERPRLQLEACGARARSPGHEALLGPVTAAAEAAGVQPGMRLGEALATCPSLQLVERDPAAAEEAWEEIVRRLEDAGFSVEPAAPGCAYFETRGVERLYGGLEPALKRALAGGRARLGCACGRGEAPLRGAGRGERRPLGAGAGRRPTSRRATSSRRCRSTLLPLEAGRRQELAELGTDEDRRACRAAGWRRGRTSGAGRPARLEPGERRLEAGGSADGSPPRSCSRRSSSRRRSATS